MYISVFPGLGGKEIWAPAGRRGFPPPLDRKNTVAYYRGANAVYAGVRLLGLSAKDTVLMPAYHCGVEVEAVLRAGAGVQFYGVNDKLCCDLEDIRRKIDGQTKAVFIIHYFGFPQAVEEIRKICRQRNLYLIEDCAHSLYSQLWDKYLGEFGDVSLFSFQKTLPVPDGGALMVNNERLAVPPKPVKKPSRISTARGVALLWLERYKMRSEAGYQVLDWLALRPARLLWRGFKNLAQRRVQVTTANTAAFDAGRAEVGMADFSSRIIQSADNLAIFDSRRRNYEILLNRLSDLRLLQVLYRALPEGVCPLFLPLLVENRDELQERLRKKGVETFIFGKTLHPLLPQGQFPIAETCSRGNLCLPIHQDLGREQMIYMADVLKAELSGEV